MTRLLSSGALPARVNPLDARGRLIACRDVIKLLTLPTLENARKALGVFKRKMTGLLQSNALPHRRHPLNEHAFTVNWADVESLLASGGKVHGAALSSPEHFQAEAMSGIPT